jgi:hypothetical protein
VTDELPYLLFLSSSFALKTAIELDFSLFLLDSMTLTRWQAPFLVITDGTGRTAIYNCHTPAELVPAEGQSNAASAKAQTNKPIQLEPILELDKCPISTGPVTSYSQLAQRTDDPSARKRPAKKKAAAPAKGKPRAKSPGTVALETASPTETTKYHAAAHVFDQVAVLRFGTFPMFIVYSLQSPNPILNEFALPAPVTSDIEIAKSGQLVVGLENGSFLLPQCRTARNPRPRVPAARDSHINTLPGRHLLHRDEGPHCL